MKMQLIFCLLFLEFIYVNSDSWSLHGELKKYGSLNLNNLESVYLDLNNFKDESYIYLVITVYNGYFWYDNIQYTSSSTISGTKYFDKTVSYYSYSYGSKDYYSSYYYYDYYTLRFKIDKPSYRYLFVGPSRISCYNSCYIKIENVSGFGLSVAIIVVIVIAVIAIAAASIVVYFCRRARRASYIAPPVAEYQPPVAAATAYPPPTYY